jgi:hypothetical protein
MVSQLLLLPSLLLLFSASSTRPEAPTRLPAGLQASQSTAPPELPPQNLAPKSEFEPSWSYFQRGRTTGFPSFVPGSHYRLKATFQIPTPSNGLATGRYEDTFVDLTHWRREAWVGTSHLVRTRDGNHRYLDAEGPDASVLLMVLRVTEPLPDNDTLDDSVWVIRHDTVGDIPTIRLAYGPETPSGDLVPGEGQGFWFDAQGKLLRAVTGGVDILRSDFMPFNGTQVAQTSVVRVTGGGVAMRVRVGSVDALTSHPPEWDFVIAGHEWKPPVGDDMR